MTLEPPVSSRLHHRERYLLERAPASPHSWHLFSCRKIELSRSRKNQTLNYYSYRRAELTHTHSKHFEFKVLFLKVNKLRPFLFCQSERCKNRIMRFPMGRELRLWVPWGSKPDTERANDSCGTVALQGCGTM